MFSPQISLGMDYIFTQLLSFRLRLEPTFYRESLILYPFCQMAETSLYGVICSNFWICQRLLMAVDKIYIEGCGRRTRDNRIGAPVAQAAVFFILKSKNLSK